MQLDIQRNDMCSPCVQILLQKNESVNCLMIIRGCTEDLLKLETTAKLILYYANKLLNPRSQLTTDFVLFYSPMSWKQGSFTNLDKLFKEDTRTSPIIIPSDFEPLGGEPIRSLKELLNDRTGKLNII